MDNIIILKKEIFSRVNKPALKISNFFDINERNKLDKNIFDNIFKIRKLNQNTNINNIQLDEKNNNQGK
jgi:hypothetical protein